MSPAKAARNWKITAGVSTAAVIVLILLWPKLRAAAGDLIFGDTIISIPAPGAVDYPDIYLDIHYPPTTETEPCGTTCGCEGANQEMIDAAMSYFVNGMMDIQDRYLASILAGRPDWAVQYWNNSLGYSMSQNTGRIFG